MAMVKKRVYWLIFFRPLSPSACIFCTAGTAMPNNWMIIDAEMYGMMPNAKIEARVKAPPVNKDNKSPKPPLPD